MNLPANNSLRGRALRCLAAALTLAIAACQPAQAPMAAPDAAASASAPAASASPSSDVAPVVPAAVATTTESSAAEAPVPVADASDHAQVNATIDRLLGDHARYEQVIQSFQQAVAANNVDAVAALVRYPLKATIDGKSTTVSDVDDFVQHYDAIVSPAMAKVIVEQQYADLFVNQQGVMFGDGQAWITGVCVDEACKNVDVRVGTLQ